ncbi:hypothetical protein NHH03_00290 [Stieleria sp. TO1_6]|uniref:hypothetical protein n=1 Tax=Stieleria tagensis TaxID=2956795 RepID=UPI00209BAD48|nr:hypothetical protein [Stieleria tagensis]MCO8120158.1 hypothetical protein [Stieleria tagensis]
MISEPAQTESSPGRPRAVVLLALIAISSPWVLAFALGPREPRIRAWRKSVYEKQESRAEQVSSPKVILIGGSNVLFGVDRYLLENELGLPVVKLGPYAPIGADVIADRATRFIEPGDTVVLMAEWSNYENSTNNSSRFDRYDWQESFPAIEEGRVLSDRLKWFWISRRTLSKVRERIDSLPRRFGNAALAVLGGSATDETEPAEPRRTRSGDIYTVESFDESGEPSVARELPRKTQDQMHGIDFPTHLDFVDNRSERFGNAVHLLDQACSERQATLLVLPPITLAIAGVDAKARENAQRELASSLKQHGFPVAFSPGQLTGKAEWAFDTPYHPIDRGTEHLSRELAQIIKPWLLDPTR